MELPFDWDVPEGWAELPPTQMRQINLRPAGDPKAECYLTILQSDGGGMLDNVNRWRAQMSLDPIDAAEADALPRTTLLGREALLLELEGAYGGMNATSAESNYKMLGVILELPMAAIFIKFTGPADRVDAEREAFDAFRASLRLSEMDPHAGVDTSEQPAPEPAAPAPGLTWNTPEGWTESGARPMRLVTFTMGETGATECYIAELAGTGGGLLANFNRWAGQMGAEPLPPEALADLPTIDVLGQSAPYVVFSGDYTDMAGETYEAQALMGAIVELDDRALFIKMTGPAVEVETQRDNFAAFCESFEIP